MMHAVLKRERAGGLHQADPGALFMSESNESVPVLRQRGPYLAHSLSDRTMIARLGSLQARLRSQWSCSEVGERRYDPFSVGIASVGARVTVGNRGDPIFDPPLVTTSDV